jgi:hypothetical protein
MKRPLLSAIFAGSLGMDEVNEMRDRWCQRALRPRLPSLLSTIRNRPNAYEKVFHIHQTGGIQWEVRAVAELKPRSQ